MDRMLDIVCAEMDKISEVGITGANLDRALKLSQLKDNLMDAEYKETKKYMMDSTGEYSKDYPSSKTRTFGFAANEEDPYNKYMESKKTYRFARTPESKRTLMHDLENYMEEMTGNIADLMKDAECQEERAMIQRYMTKMRDYK